VKGRLPAIAGASVLFFGGFAVSADAPADAGLPPALAGAWEVEGVAVDRADQPHWRVRPDEPELMGRELVIDADHVQFNGGKTPNCKPAGWKRHATTWGTLVAGSQLRGGSPGVETDPAPADYGLKVGRKAGVTVYSFCGSPPDPKHPVVNASGWMMEPWLAPQGADRAIMHLDESTLLVLTRRKRDARPQASFPCGRAASVTEKAICASFTLAAWDRSVALAWRRASEGAAPGPATGQKEWLRTRDACGADPRCLEEKMSSRTAELRTP
jgi:hypothetical protein